MYLPVKIQFKSVRRAYRCAYDRSGPVEAEKGRTNLFNLVLNKVCKAVLKIIGGFAVNKFSVVWKEYPNCTLEYQKSYFNTQKG